MHPMHNNMAAICGTKALLAKLSKSVHSQEFTQYSRGSFCCFDVSCLCVRHQCLLTAVQHFASTILSARRLSAVCQLEHIPLLWVLLVCNQWYHNCSEYL